MNTALTPEEFYSEHEKEDFVSKPECIRLMELYHMYKITETDCKDGEKIKEDSFNNGLKSG